MPAKVQLRKSDEEGAAKEGKKRNRGNRDKNKSGLPKKQMKKLIKKLSIAKKLLKYTISEYS